MKSIKDYTQQRGPSLPLRIFKEDKPRFNELTRRLVLASGGEQFSQAQVIRYLLDLAENWEKYQRLGPFPRPEENWPPKAP